MHTSPLTAHPERAPPSAYYSDIWEYIMEPNTVLTKKQIRDEQVLKRDFNLDLLRIISTLFVVGVHFFLYTGFYNIDVHSPVMMFCMVIRNTCLTCIPLFIMLTGYLQGNKKISPTLRYYVKILKFIVPYVLIVIFEGVMMHFFMDGILNFGIIARNIAGFSGYSWYVEMYIGLFLLIPFLNILWQNMKTRKQEHILLGVLIFLTILPTVINVYDTGSVNFWNAENKDYFPFIPDFWKNMYPVTGYFIGAYLNKYKDKIVNRLKSAGLLLCFLGATALTSVYTITRNIGTTPSVYSWLNRNSFFLYLCAVFFFMFIVSLRLEGAPLFIRKSAAKLSDLSYGAFLVSYTVDTLLYAKLCSIIDAGFYHILVFYPVAVIIILTTSFILSFLIDFIAKLIIKLAEKIIFGIKSAITKGK